MNKDQLFFAAIAKIQSRAHVTLITSAIENYAMTPSEGKADYIHKMIRNLRDPKEYSVIVDFFFMKLLNENLKNKKIINLLIELRERVRIHNFTALAEIADDVDSMLKSN